MYAGGANTRTRHRCACVHSSHWRACDRYIGAYFNERAVSFVNNGVETTVGQNSPAPTLGQWYLVYANWTTPVSGTVFLFARAEGGGVEDLHGRFVSFTAWASDLSNEELLAVARGGSGPSDQVIANFAADQLSVTSAGSTISESCGRTPPAVLRSCDTFTWTHGGWQYEPTCTRFWSTESSMITTGTLASAPGAAELPSCITPPTCPAQPLQLAAASGGSSSTAIVQVYAGGSVHVRAGGSLVIGAAVGAAA